MAEIKYWRKKYDKNPLKSRLNEIDGVLGEITNISKSSQLLDVYLAKNKSPNAREELDLNINILNKEKLYILELLNKNSTKKTKKKTKILHDQELLV